MSRHAALPQTTESRIARHKVFLPAELTQAAGTTRVHLLNLSATGALVHGEPAPTKGTVVQLSCDDTNWLARVVWAQQKRFGIVHVAPMAPGVVNTLVTGRGGI